MPISPSTITQLHNYTILAKIGFNVLAWSAVVSEDLNPIADRLKEIGYDGVECFVGAADDPAAYQAFGKHVADLVWK